MPKPSFYIMRHGETVYNVSRRIQSNAMHTPLTAVGCRQAVEMGVALKQALGFAPSAILHVSDTNRALQTAALIAEELGIDWFAARRDRALHEIDMGSWCDQLYAEVESKFGSILDSDLLIRPAPDGENYIEIERRLRNWLSRLEALPAGMEAVHIVVMHGISSRVLRGILADYPVHTEHGVPVAPALIQGSISLIEGGRETAFFGAPVRLEAGRFEKPAASGARA